MLARVFKTPAATLFGRRIAPRLDSDSAPGVRLLSTKTTWLHPRTSELKPAGICALNCTSQNFDSHRCSMLFRKELLFLFEKVLNIDANISFGMCNLVYKFLVVSVRLFKDGAVLPWCLLVVVEIHCLRGGIVPHLTQRLRRKNTAQSTNCKRHYFRGRNPSAGEGVGWMPP